jgi:hypothetical protein
MGQEGWGLERRRESELTESDVERERWGERKTECGGENEIPVTRTQRKREGRKSYYSLAF